MKTKRFIIIILLALSVIGAYGKGKTLARTLERIDSALDMRPESEKSRHAESYQLVGDLRTALDILSTTAPLLLPDRLQLLLATEKRGISRSATIISITKKD